MDYTVIIFIMFVIDFLSTYFFMKIYTSNFEGDKWIRFENNILMKYYWRRFGLELGSFLTFISVFPIVLFVYFMMQRVAFLFPFFMGIYYMIAMLHLKSYNELLKKINDRKRG